MLGVLTSSQAGAGNGHRARPRTKLQVCVSKHLRARPIEILRSVLESWFYACQSTHSGYASFLLARVCLVIVMERILWLHATFGHDAFHRGLPEQFLSASHQVFQTFLQSIFSMPLLHQDFGTVTEIWTILHPVLRLSPLGGPFYSHSGICVHTGRCVRLLGGTSVANKFLGEAIFDERFETCEVSGRSTWGFAFGVAVSLCAF